MPRAVPSLASLLDDGEARKRRIARLSHERELARDAEVYRAELTDQLKRVERRLARMTSPDRAPTTSLFTTPTPIVKDRFVHSTNIWL